MVCPRFSTRFSQLDDSGHCKYCKTAIAGRYATFDKPFGARRIPVRLHGG